MARQAEETRWARLGADTIQLEVAMPQIGERLNASFSIPAARHAESPLTAAELSQGLVIVSTLPNIQKHACIAQIVDLEAQAKERVPSARLAHISADHADHWLEVDRFHPDVETPGYSLCCADPVDRHAFAQAFGVSVLDHQRVAHGLFALREGIFVAVAIPEDQMRTPVVADFLGQLCRRLGQAADPSPQPTEEV
jgi:peroxiredoxin